MHPASLLISLLVAFSPLVLAGEGPTFCQSVDKLKVTSPLTFITPVPSVNLKWNPKICLCQSEGALTDNTINQLEAKITKEGVSKLSKKLGLDTLPPYWEEQFVRQAVLTAAEDFLDQYKSCPRGCEYPKGAIPNSCKDCGYDCPKGQVKCNKKCQKPNKPCPSKDPKPPKPPKTTSSDGYPTNLTYRKRDATDAEETATITHVIPAPTAASLDAFMEDHAIIDSEEGFEELLGQLELLGTGTPTAWAVSDIPEPTLIQQYYRSTNNNKCEPGWIPCAVLKKGKADWECTDVLKALDSCGGCIYPILPGRIGVSCSDETGANEVACVKGHCKIKSCQRGFAHNGTACEPQAHTTRYSLE